MTSFWGQRDDDGRWFCAAAERNRDPILAVLRRHLPSTGLVLEIASGTGQHIVHFARLLPGLVWQPSDPDAELRHSIRGRTEQAGLGNVRPPLDLDVTRFPWPLSKADSVLSINMVHIAPWGAVPALFAGAGQVLGAGGPLYLYGPFRRDGRHTAPSNERFDRQLRARDPAWGLRDLEAVVEQGRLAGFQLIEVVDMPSNNFSVVFSKTAAVPHLSSAGQ
jgi:SAM-dependent methyltransferase